MQTFTLGKHPLSFRDEGRGVPLLLIHGFPLTSAAWKLQFEKLGDGFRVIACDLRGFGKSDAVGEVTTMADFADDLVALLQHLKISEAVVVGHSMGGYVALNLVSRFPEKVKGLVLVGTKAGADSEEAAKKRHETAAKVLGGGADAVLKDTAPKMLGKASGNPPEKNSTDKMALAQEVEKTMRPVQPRGLANALRGMAMRPDSTPHLGHITAPTLVVSGDADQLIPCEESKTLAAKIPGATLKLVAGAGHLVAFEKAAEFNALLTAWLVRFL